MSILLVEDDPLLRSVFERVFRSLNYEVVIAEDGQKAKEKLAEGLVPDMIWSDDDMPNLTGGELLEWVRENPATANIPFVLASGKPKDWIQTERGRLRFVFAQKPMRVAGIQAALAEARELVSAQ